MLWGHLIAFWDVWGFRLMVAGGVLGFFALVSSLLSSFVLYRVDGAQKDLLSAQSRAFAEKIGTLNRDAEALKASNLKLYQPA